MATKLSSVREFTAVMKEFLDMLDKANNVKYLHFNSVHDYVDVPSEDGSTREPVGTLDVTMHVKFNI